MISLVSSDNRILFEEMLFLLFVVPIGAGNNNDDIDVDKDAVTIDRLMSCEESSSSSPRWLLCCLFRFLCQLIPSRTNKATALVEMIPQLEMSNVLSLREFAHAPTKRTNEDCEGLQRETNKQINK